MFPVDAEHAKTIGRRVQALRAKRGKTLQVIADFAGFSKSKLDRIERGESALDKLSDIVALADALEVSPSDLVRLPVPAPANGHTDATIRAVRRALDAIEGEEPNGVVLPVAVLRRQITRIHDQRRAGHLAEVAADLPGLIRNLHTTLATGAGHGELLDVAVYLHVHVTRTWLFNVGAPVDLMLRTVFLARRLARERNEVAILALAGFAVTDALLCSGEFEEGEAIRSSIVLPPTTADTAGLVALLAANHAIAALLDGRPEDTAAPMDAAAELAQRFGAAGEPDSLGVLYSPTTSAIDRMYLALEADEPDQAISVAQGVDPRRHPFPVNQAYYWIHSGRALSRLPGRGDDAVRALRTAESIQPTATLRHQSVREVIGEMLTVGSARTMRLELRAMAYRAGVLIEDHPSD